MGLYPAWLGPQQLRTCWCIPLRSERSSSPLVQHLLPDFCLVKL